MKNTRRNKSILISAFALFTILLIVLASGSQIVNAKKITEIISSNNTELSKIDTDFFEINADGDHKLTILEYSHYNRPIYPNYTQVDLAVALEGEEFAMSDVDIHYSQDKINWTTKTFTNIRALSPNSTLFEVSIGPFTEVGMYSVKINATRGSLEHATIFYTMQVEEINGLIFLDFDHQLVELENETQLVNLQVSILGTILINDSVRVIVDQIDYNSSVMKLIDGSTNRYNATMGSIMHWEEYVHVTFIGNTILGKEFNSTNFLFHKGPPKFEEPFLTSLLPAIIVGLLVLGSMSTIFIMAKRRAPKKFDIEDSDKEELKAQLRKKMKKEKRRKKDKVEKKDDLF
ncbi:MAG: hypothetical protein ACTSPM_00510 [Candidatus Heimdallarchaeota archaeon]